VNSLPGSSLDLRDRQLSEVDSPAAWRRLGFAVAVGTIGSVGMWSMPVALPFVQADFGIARADASLPYTLAMAGFALGGVAMGRLYDRLASWSRSCWAPWRSASAMSVRRWLLACSPSR
jgi:MFS family permease